MELVDRAAKVPFDRRNRNVAIRMLFGQVKRTVEQPVRQRAAARASESQDLHLKSGRQCGG
jgi:hypothetical protein